MWIDGAWNTARDGSSSHLKGGGTFLCEIRDTALPLHTPVKTPYGTGDNSANHSLRSFFQTRTFPSRAFILYIFYAEFLHYTHCYIALYIIAGSITGVPATTADKDTDAYNAIYTVELVWGATGHFNRQHIESTKLHSTHTIQLHDPFKIHKPKISSRIVRALKTAKALDEVRICIT